MQQESFDALFNSPDEVDIELKQSGEEIYMSHGGKQHIPGQYQFKSHVLTLVTLLVLYLGIEKARYFVSLLPSS